MHDYSFPIIEKKIALLLESCLASLGVSQPKGIVLELPKDSSLGNISSNIALRCAAQLKKNPKQCADDIVVECTKKLAALKLDSLIADIKVAAPGFINFYFQDSFFHAMLAESIRHERDFGKLDIGNKKKVMVEFVSANPTGPLSIAHGRQAAVGDSFANILASLGFSVSREYYNNDIGNQITILGKSVELRYRELKGETVDFPEDHYQGDYIRDLAKELLGKADHKDTNYFSDYAAQCITDIIKKELDDFGVYFDCWYSQKKLTQAGKIEATLELLREKGFIYDSEGAMWFKSTAFGDDKDRVLRKSDGNYTYFAPDIAYHYDKFKRGFERLINLWGPDHHGYIPRITAAVQALGYPKEALSVIIVQLATLYRDGKPVPMSTRRGQYITLREVMEEVGKDAARFFMLMRRTDSHLDFDLELAKKQSPENPVYYIQYAHARICNILANAKEVKIDYLKADCSLLKEKEEKELLRLVFEFSYTQIVCLRQLDAYALTVYLQQLANAFHRFYDHHRVLGDDKPLSAARLALIYCVKIVFAKGLNLLGIAKPEKM